MNDRDRHTKSLYIRTKNMYDREADYHAYLFAAWHGITLAPVQHNVLVKAGLAEPPKFGRRRVALTDEGRRLCRQIVTG